MGAFDLSIDFQQRTANLKANIANTQITTPKLHAGSLTVTSLNAVTITSSIITGSEITGTTLKTSATGDRVEIDGPNGERFFDDTNAVFVQIKGTVYAGILVNGLRSINANDIFLESQNQSVQLFLSQASNKILFVVGGSSRAQVDNSDGTGGGNQPTSFSARVNGALHRLAVQQGVGPGLGYAYFV